MAVVRTTYTVTSQGVPLAMKEPPILRILRAGQKTSLEPVTLTLGEIQKLCASLARLFRNQILDVFEACGISRLSEVPAPALGMVWEVMARTIAHVTGACVREVHGLARHGSVSLATAVAFARFAQDETDYRVIEEF